MLITRKIEEEEEETSTSTRLRSSKLSGVHEERKNEHTYTPCKE